MLGDSKNTGSETFEHLSVTCSSAPGHGKRSTRNSDKITILQAIKEAHRDIEAHARQA